MAGLSSAQALHHVSRLQGEEEAKGPESLFLAALDAALPGGRRERATMTGQHGMVEEGVLRIRGRAPPEARGPAEEQDGVQVPVLEEVDQGILVIEGNQRRVDGIELVANHVMKRHARVLRGALDQPVQGEALVDLV